MKAGEFARKLKTAINDAGYTSNNVNIIDIYTVLRPFGPESTTFSVTLEGNDGQIFSVFIEED